MKSGNEGDERSHDLLWLFKNCYSVEMFHLPSKGSLAPNGQL